MGTYATPYIGYGVHARIDGLTDRQLERVEQLVEEFEVPLSPPFAEREPLMFNDMPHAYAQMDEDNNLFVFGWYVQGHDNGEPLVFDSFPMPDIDHAHGLVNYALDRFDLGHDIIERNFRFILNTEMSW